MQEIKGFLFDIDGVIMRGGRPVPGAVDALNALAQGNYRVGYVTNDNETTRQACVAKIAPFGFPVSVETMMTAGAVAAQFAQTHLQGKRVLVVGSDTLGQTFRDAGVATVPLAQADAAEAVVMGRDVTFDFARLTLVARVVARLGEFYATNLDAQLPIEGTFNPGTGAMIMAVAHAARVQPQVLGKPSRRAAEMSAALLGLAGRELAVVGDSPAQDIAMGTAAGMRTFLVLTGVATRASLVGLPEEQQPDVVLNNVAELPHWLAGELAH